MTKSVSMRELRRIPGVGKSIAEDLWGLNIRSIRDLKGRDAEELYEQFCDKSGTRIDRCLLYVFRCAIYYASRTRHNPELLKWWNWKD